MSRLVVETSEGIALTFDVAGVGSRSAAAAIDLILWSLAVLFAFFATAVAQSIDPTGLSQFVFGLVIGGALLSLVVYHIAIPAIWGGLTPGKALLGIRVRDVQGRPATFVQLVLRSLFFPVELALAVPISIGILVMGTTERSQRLGDLVAGTLVLRDPIRRTTAEPYARAKWDDLPNRRLGLSPALAARLDGEDLRYLRALLGRTNLDLRSRQKLLLGSARHYAQKLGVDLGKGLKPREAHAVLRELYLFLREQSRFLRQQDA